MLQVSIFPEVQESAVDEKICKIQEDLENIWHKLEELKEKAKKLKELKESEGVPLAEPVDKIKGLISETDSLIDAITVVPDLRNTWMHAKLEIEKTF